MKILITGANGQLGKSLQSRLTAHQLEAHDLPTLDLTDPAAITDKLASFQPDWVINAAAYTAVDKAESDIDAANQINHVAVASLAKACARQNAKLVQVSTDFIFDGQSSTPYATGAKPNPLSVYGKTKLNGEKAALQYLPNDCYIVRTAWLYSEFGNNFVKTMLKLMHERPQLKIICDQTGSPTSAHSLAGMIANILETTPAPGIYHCTDAGTASWYDFAVAIMEEGLAAGLLAKPVDILPIPTSDYPTPATRPAYSVLDKSASWNAALLLPVHWRTPLQAVIHTLAQQEYLRG